jgi:hypothetical protein
MRRVAVLLLAACFGAMPAVAQTGELRALIETYRRDRLELHDYVWKQRTEVAVNDEVTERTLARVRYDADGRLQKTPIDETDDKRVRGPVRRHRAKKQQKKTAEFIESLHGLILSYVQFTPQQMRSAFARASVFPGEGETEGMIRVQARSVVRQGDVMSLWADAATRRLRRIEILTSLEGEPVEVLTEFRELEIGSAYPATTTVRTERKGKTVVIRTENFDHARGAG